MFLIISEELALKIQQKVLGKPISLPGGAVCIDGLMIRSIIFLEIVTIYNGDEFPLIIQTEKYEIEVNQNLKIKNWAKTNLSR
jgi:LEA14-like dessication related protein